MKTVLNWRFTEGRKWNTGRIEIEDLSIDSEDTIHYEEIKLFLDDEPYTGGISTWYVNNVDADFIFVSVLNSYLRGDCFDFQAFTGDWNIFDTFYNRRKVENGILLEFPQYYYGINMYTLVFATRDARYYTSDAGGDEVMLLNDQGNILTDIEAFYTSALTADVGRVLLGKAELVYDDGVTMKDLIEHYGKDALIEEAREAEEREEKE